MLSPKEREEKKGVFAKALRAGGNADTKRYQELYDEFCENGYSRSFAEEYADAFVNDRKKPLVEDILQTIRLFDKAHDYGNAEYYLGMLSDKKLCADDKFSYCIEALKNKSKQGHWRDAEDFRTENISFMQKYSEKVNMDRLADLYIALALADCSAKHYTQGFKLLTGFGYKPKGKNDVKLLEILITGIYICSKSGSEGGVYNAVSNAHGAMKLFSKFAHPWTEDYYEQCIREASEGII
ncbi:MAG: hypothetical protein K5979_04315 [Ruminococcus sp.]|nr:hypothetical protein [Ruminococcus sp.]